jgi:hypothetical protein
MVNVILDWRKALPHPDEHVRYEFWTFSNDKCGPKCDSQIDLVRSFIRAAQVLENKGYTEFTHYIRLSATAYSKFFFSYTTLCSRIFCF